ncbi:MAG: DUF2325 domain-containing protein [Lautropia sp.]
MQVPPFRSSLQPTAFVWARRDADVDQSLESIGQSAESPPTAGVSARLRFADLDSHLHCSIIGTCLTTSELRKLMRETMEVSAASDLEIHHEAVRQSSLDPAVARRLHKALDRRHAAVLARFERLRDGNEVALLWRESLQAGEIPGAYWAVMTHRRTSSDLRQQAFGDVHMLSHLVGAANRADIRRLVALEQENAALREQRDQARRRLANSDIERDAAVADRAALRARLAAAERHAERASAAPGAAEMARRLEELSSAVALQTGRREAAEADAEGARREAERLSLELARLQQSLVNVAAELEAVEAEFRRRVDRAGPDRLQTALAARRILYVGGRPSTTAAIRELVESAGGEFRKHDGGIEDRKGLLAPALAWSDLVVFPVDCIDHDSALSLKRDCTRHGRPFLPLRSASVASFIVALAGDGKPDPGMPRHCCPRHG